MTKEDKEKRKDYQKKYYQDNRTKILALMTKNYHDKKKVDGKITRGYRKKHVGPIYAKYEGKFTLTFS